MTSAIVSAGIGSRIWNRLGSSGGVVADDTEAKQAHLHNLHEAALDHALDNEKDVVVTFWNHRKESPSTVKSIVIEEETPMKEVTDLPPSAPLLASLPPPPPPVPITPATAKAKSITITTPTPPQTRSVLRTSSLDILPIAATTRLWGRSRAEEMQRVQTLADNLKEENDMLRQQVDSLQRTLKAREAERTSEDLGFLEEDFLTMHDSAEPLRSSNSRVPRGARRWSRDHDAEFIMGSENKADWNKVEDSGQMGLKENNETCTNSKQKEDEALAAQITVAVEREIALSLELAESRELVDTLKLKLRSAEQTIQELREQLEKVSANVKNKENDENEPATPLKADPAAPVKSVEEPQSIISSSFRRWRSSAPSPTTPATSVASSFWFLGQAVTPSSSSQHAQSNTSTHSVGSTTDMTNSQSSGHNDNHHYEDPVEICKDLAASAYIDETPAKPEIPPIEAV